MALSFLCMQVRGVAQWYTSEQSLLLTASLALSLWKQGMMTRPWQPVC